MAETDGEDTPSSWARRLAVTGSARWARLKIVFR
jgi:hypothetical protein